MALDWQSLLAAIASITAAILLVRAGYLKAPSTAFALVATMVAGISYTVDFSVNLVGAQSPTTQIWSDFMWLLVAALILVSLANFLRDDKPPFAQYPFFFTLLPLIVLPVYPFIADTVVIKNWVLALYQFGALVMAGLLFSLISTKDTSYRLIVLSVGFFALAWFTKWMVVYQSTGRWVFTISIILGMILATKSFYDRVNNQHQIN
jgi:hypothetical protein